MEDQAFAAGYDMSVLDEFRQQNLTSYHNLARRARLV
jgi:hypothetical protein